MTTRRSAKTLPSVPSTEDTSVSNGKGSVDDHHSSEPRDTVWVSLTKQAKFILLGGLPVWYLDVPASFYEVLKYGGEDWSR